MQSEFEDDSFQLEYFVGACTPHLIQNSLELQIVNDLEKTYRPRYKMDYYTSNGNMRTPRYVRDRVGNHYVTLKGLTPNLQGKVRVDWLTISNNTGQRYVMPYQFQVSNDSIEIPDCNPIMCDIHTNMNGLMKLYLVLIKGKLSQLEQAQPLVLFQPVMDALHKPSIPSYQQIPPKQLFREFQLDKSQLAFTLCKTTDGVSFVPQWHTTVFSTVMTEEMVWTSRNQIVSLKHHRILSSSINTHDGYEQELPMVEDTMERSKRQRLDDPRLNV